MSYPAHAKAISLLGLPLIGGHIGQVAIGVTDTVMLGWYGVDSLAAGTLGSSYFFLFFLAGAGFAWAVMPIVASANASDDVTSMRRAARMGVWLSAVFGIVALPAMLFSYPVLIATGQEPGIAADAALYLTVAGWGLFPALGVMVLKSYLAALERTQIVFWITIVGAIANGLSNYMLIFGNWGAPEMGIVGAALASVITQTVMLIGVIIYVQRVLPEHQIFVRAWKPDWDMMGRVFRLGVPIGLTSVSEVGLFTASAFMMGWLGAVPLAAHGIALNLASITFMVHLGLANVATIRSGNAYGRNDIEDMKRGARVVIVMSIAVALATIAAFLIWAEPLIAVFIQDNEPEREAIVQIGIVLLALAALFQLVDGAQAVALGLLRGVQDTLVPAALAAVAYWGVGIPASYALGFILNWEGVGVWLGLVLGLAFASVLLMGRFWLKSVPNLSKPT
ncbi:MAG: MATE family efflux transporter [Rhodobacteraceae bacterium]|nr:MATE family efflux transporter [Paracoccaceae bacterium]